MISGCWVTIVLISVSVEDGDVFDFRGMRLDWFRLQVCTQSWDFRHIYPCIHSEHRTLPDTFVYLSCKNVLLHLSEKWCTQISLSNSADLGESDWNFFAPLFCRPTQVFQKPVLVWLITRNWAKWWTPLFSTPRWWTLWWTCWWRHQTFLFSGKRHRIVQCMHPVCSK